MSENKREKDLEQSEYNKGQDDILMPKSWSDPNVVHESLTGFGGLAIFALIISFVVAAVLAFNDIGITFSSGDICWGNLTVVCLGWLVFLVVVIILSSVLDF
ncbi:MAG: hypothetical protein V5A76_08410 [Candidatus Thermoplasmatota archaeon]